MYLRIKEKRNIGVGRVDREGEEGKREGGGGGGGGGSD